MNSSRSLLLIFSGAFFIAAAPIPDGWRLPIKKEFNQDWRKGCPEKCMAIKADFNGDGIEDEARILVKQNGKGAALFAFVSQEQEFKTYKLADFKSVESLSNMGLAIAEKGEYETACGKGYWACKKGEPEKITLRHLSIDLFISESGYSFFIWSDKKEDFYRIWIAD